MSQRLGFGFAEEHRWTADELGHASAIMDGIARREAWRRAAELERQARAIVLERFPVFGPWLVEHPRALALLFRLRPSLRPTIVHRITTITTAR